MSSFLLPQDKKISKEIFLLSFPIILSNLSRVLMSVVDVAMVGRLGTEALAATGMGSMMFWGALSLAIGIRTAVQTVTARRLGQGLFKESGTALRNGLVLATSYSIPTSFFVWSYSDSLVRFFIEDPAATPLTRDYVSIVFLGLLFSSYSFVFQGFFTGIEKTKVHMKVTIVSNVLNVYLNAGFIYGSSGIQDFFNEHLSNLSLISYLWGWVNFPALGVKGAAIATLISSFWMAAHYTASLLSKETKVKYSIFIFSFDSEMMKRQVRLALPQGVQESVIALGWGVFYKIVGIIGLIELATTELLFTIMHASFMPAMGVGQACSTLVSKYMGQGRPEKSETSIKESVRIAEYIMAPMGLSFIFFPEFYLYIFTNDLKIINMGAYGLRIVGALQFIDAVGFVLWFALSGAGNTFFPAMVEAVLTWVIIVLGSYIVGVYYSLGFNALWWLFPLHLGLFAVIMTWKTKQGDWKKIEV
ncbi:MAG: hypothetical protein CMG04_00300 [Candidatus Marinimicrobia bacterium]|nr:hypothetical protein [Candidatus Neomarinimicrobiota bacterium]